MRTGLGRRSLALGVGLFGALVVAAAPVFAAYAAGAPVRVPDNPLGGGAACAALVAQEQAALPNDRVYPDAEVEPWIAATGANTFIGGVQQDRWAGGGSNGLTFTYFDGRAWHRVLLAKNNTSSSGQGIFPDGTGGLWIPAGDGAHNPALLHYSDGKLTPVTLPEQASWVPTIADSLARIPGTSEMLAGGVQYTDGNNKTNSVILEYS